MVKVYVDGQAGTTGLKIFERLSARSDVTIMRIPDEKRKDAAARSEMLNSADVVFLCLPDDAAREAVSMIRSGSVRVIDASTAHRTNPDFDYGFPELSTERRANIIGSKRVAVPGCHASGFISLVYPLTASGALDKSERLSAHSITGYSGGGRKMIEEYENPQRDKAYSGTRIYSLGLSHKHLPEMAYVTGLLNPPIFDPILGDYYEGMLVSVPLSSGQLGGRSAEQIHEIYAKHYEGSRFVKVMPLGEIPDGGRLDPQALNGTNEMQIFVFANGDDMLLVSRFDNLGKGASGAAVQCFNLMTGAKEDEGLTIC
ncbi:MAG: N-acetyl-gamma-glutamyl-phosphate reductase [Eubacteriales bacterium]|nr:N-acetyl-gamma-glutamyl-phosphate reductase [Eubacteriales bacterium]MDD3882671.1 N-acetyl-gamma-glutamyl-phosphate reductase [Eubacteriales bacterium]MDD4512757.1 N-acetyl-gamma-glutamyl-phosphate reductase [Eubacteriales bacterium]